MTAAGLDFGWGRSVIYLFEDTEDALDWWLITTSQPGHCWSQTRLIMDTTAQTFPLLPALELFFLVFS